MMTTFSKLNDFPFAGARRLQVLVGHYGSGKTEISINLALRLRAMYPKVLLIDLDIVNPFFRSAEVSPLLQEKGVDVVYPTYAKTGVDIPVLPADVTRAFYQTDYRCVFDVGGDEDGAAALGRYIVQFNATPADVYLVINPFRPLSATAQSIIMHLRGIEERARIPVTGIIANPNLAGETTAEDMLFARTIIEDAAAQAHVPIIAEAGLPEVLSQLDGKYPRFPIQRYLKPEWMDL